MKLDPRALLSFVLTFMVVFALCLAIFPSVMKFYQPAVFGPANLILSWMDPPTRIEITDNGEWRAFNMERGFKRAWQRWKSWVKYLHFLSLPLLPALLLATPAPWRDRLRLLAIAVPLLYIVHVLTVVGIVRGHYCLLLDQLRGRSELSCILMVRVVNTSGQLFGAGLWLLLTWRYWIPGKPAKPA